MLRSLAITLCATTMALASPKVESTRVRTALLSSWQVLRVSLVIKDACTGLQQVGFRISRDKDQITLTNLKIQGGQPVTGPARNLSKTELDTILQSIAQHYDTALASKSTREALNERLALLSTPQEKKREIAQTSRNIDLTSMSIAISLSDRPTEEPFMDDFDMTSATAFSNWLQSTTQPK